MAQATNIKLIENERDNDNIKFDEQDHEIDFGQLLKGMAPSNNDFEKEWNEAMTGEEFLGEIKEVIHTHFKNKK